MTFDHQIDVEPATIAPAAMALKANARQSLLNNLSLKRFADSAGPTTAIRYTTAAHLSDALWAAPCADSESAVGSSRPKTKTRGGHMSVVTTQPEMLAATRRAPRPLTRLRTAKGQ